MNRDEIKDMMSKLEDFLTDNGIAAYGIVLAIPDEDDNITVVGRAASRFPDESPQTQATHTSMRSVIGKSLAELDTTNSKKKPDYLN